MVTYSIRFPMANIARTNVTKEAPSNKTCQHLYLKKKLKYWRLEFGQRDLFYEKVQYLSAFEYLHGESRFNTKAVNVKQIAQIKEHRNITIYIGLRRTTYPLVNI